MKRLAVACVASDVAGQSFDGALRACFHRSKYVSADRVGPVIIIGASDDVALRGVGLRVGMDTDWKAKAAFRATHADSEVLHNHIPSPRFGRYGQSVNRGRLPIAAGLSRSADSQ